jgi:hypothetical protein
MSEENKPYKPKEYTLAEFVAQAKADLESYEKDWSGPDTNDYHSGSHTWIEWHNTFGRYFSWEDR